MQLMGRSTLTHSGAQDGMTRVPNLGVGGGLKHLRGVEGLESTAAIAGGRLTGSHVRKPVGHDLLSDLPLLSWRE